VDVQERRLSWVQNNIKGDNSREIIICAGWEVILL